MLNKTSSVASRMLRGVAFAAASLLATAGWAATSAPAQVPLVSRVASPPPANVMITIDDSGSMQANFMPEVGVKVNNVQVSMPVLNSMADMIDIWFGDKQVRTYSGFPIPRGVTYADPGGTNLFQRQMRSSAVNSIFYNPAVLYRPWLKPDGVTRMAEADYAAAWWDPTNTGIGNYDLSMSKSITTNWCPDWKASDCLGTADSAQYDPGLYYVLKANADPNVASNYVQYDLNGSTSSFPSSTARVCTGTGDSAGCCQSAASCTLKEERNNFANWFVYYRTRTLLMKGSMSEAVSAQVGTTNDIKLRVGWGTINSTTRTIDGVDTSVIRGGIRDLDSTQLSSVLTGIQAVNPYGSTPLRQATVTVGRYFYRDAESDAGSPWRAVPGTKDDGKKPLTCRRSYELLTTDGYYNDSPSEHAGDMFPAIKGDGNVDAANGPVYGKAGTSSPSNVYGVSPNQYIAALPYSDTQSDTLADYAMAQYVVDLQPNTDNAVGQDTKSGDLAYWQHLSMFTLGLGVTGKFDPATDLPALTSGAKKWSDGDHIDDLWHAAVDTHGMFFSAKDVVSLTQGLNDALGSAGASSRSEGGASVSTTTLSTSTFKYVPGYSPGVWSGSLKAYGFDKDNKLNTDPTWDAATLMPVATKRNIYTWDPSGVSATSVAFQASSMSATLKARIDPVPATQDNLINYIRGDQTNEGTGKAYRRRYGTLGDFTDSPPTYVQNVIDLGYDNVSTAPGYRDYLAKKNTRASGLIFEGANDGMLHVFNGTTGVEQYAYVPYAVMPHLANYASQSYGSQANFHQDFVDGPQTETDAFIATPRSSTAAWSNLVIGSFGGGAPGFYALALDVTDVTAFDSRTLMWEVNSDSPGANGNVGYISSRIAVGVFPNGAWKAFVGNGSYSANGNAVLLVVDLATGRIDASVTMPGTSGANGLGGVALMYNANKEVVAAYAGDLQGNLWRVDFTSSGTPSVGFVAAPLYRAVDATGTVQPIVAAPAIYPRSVGNMVLFGTGKLIDLTDADSTTPQSFYGIWDPTPAGAPATSASPFAGSMATKTQRSQLTQQVITTLGTDFFQVTSNDVDFVKQLGWYMDLAPVSAKQRVIYAPVVLGQWVLVNSMAPSPLPTPQSCDPVSGTSAYFLLPAESGASPQSAPVWDVNGDGSVDSLDSLTNANGDTVQAAGYSIGSSGGDTSIVSLGADLGRNLTGTPGGSGDRGYHLFCVTDCKIKNRVWRQLMTPPF